MTFVSVMLGYNSDAHRAMGETNFFGKLLLTP